MEEERPKKRYLNSNIFKFRRIYDFEKNVSSTKIKNINVNELKEFEDHPKWKTDVQKS
jgi:hypothetical protein